MRRQHLGPIGEAGDTGGDPVDGDDAGTRPPVGDEPLEAAAELRGVQLTHASTLGQHAAYGKGCDRAGLEIPTACDRRMGDHARGNIDDEA